MGASPGVDARYQPRSRPLASALAEVDASLEDVNSVTNCHLHFDHCGGNPAVADKPVFVQRTELSAARETAGYTLPELVANGQYEEIDGEADPAGRVLDPNARAHGWAPVAGRTSLRRCRHRCWADSRYG